LALVGNARSRIQNPKPKIQNGRLAPVVIARSAIQNRKSKIQNGRASRRAACQPGSDGASPPKITKSHASNIDRGGVSDRENLTSEANADETAVIVQNEEPVAVAANSGVDSGLDKPDKPPCEANGGATAEPLATPPGAPEIPGPHDAGGGDCDLIAPCSRNLAPATWPPPFIQVPHA
jgi:hypothetical protein